MEGNEILNCIKILSDFPTIYNKGNQTPVDIMKESGYPRLFSLVTIENISKYLIQKPKLIKDWINYSYDIRHSPAWAFGQGKNGNWIVSYRGNGKLIEEHSYTDKFEACAKMIKMTFEEIRT